MTELWQLAGYPWPWSRLEQAAWEADLEPDELRDWLHAEIERRRSHSTLHASAEGRAVSPGEAARAGAAGG